MTDPLSLALDELVDRLDDADGNWDDVIRRAQPSPAKEPSLEGNVVATAREPGQRGQVKRRLIAVGIVVLVALVALMATPAFGLREALVDLIGGKPVDFDDGAKAPQVVRYRFEDLGLAAPPNMNPQVIPGQTRKVGVLQQAGRKRAVWVAPARNGGFCYMLDGSYGGCLRTGKGLLPPLTTTIMGGGANPGGAPSIVSIGGNVLSDQTATVTIEFADGTAVNVPFLYVLAPIDAGFFAYDIPKEHQTANLPVAVVSRGKDGNEIWRETISAPEPPVTPVPPPRLPRRPLPTKAPIRLTAPVRTAEANGAVVRVGHNGAAEFDLTHLDESLVRLLKSVNVGYGCFALRTRFGKPYPRGYATSAPFGRHAGIPNRNVGPIDGCELQASAGHLWPDKLDSHSAVEFALTDAARRFFEDRAAARDLALLVRSKAVQKIRKLPPSEAAAALSARYSNRISPLADPKQKPPPGKIGYIASEGSLIFSRTSTTGRQFRVVVIDGKIVGPRLKPWAFVF